MSYSNQMITLVAFLMASSLVLMVSMLVSGRRARLETRLRDLSGRPGSPLDQVEMGQLARTALPKVGQVLLPSDEGERTLLTTRLIHAGLYSRQAMPIFLGVKLLLIVAPALAGLAAGAFGLVTVQEGLMLGAGLGIGGVIGPSFWLDRQKRARQTTFRRALPDALDVLVICLEGGMSLPGALVRVGEDLRTAHPALALELNIVQREIQLGRTPGEALRQMGDRLDLEEMRSLASVILQADRYGAGLVKSLRVHAETLRNKRQQRAEEMAAKAATKLLIPTILLIFPAIFVVILGPAAIHLLRIFARMGS
jgi:tight adherence protein C